MNYNDTTLKHVPAGMWIPSEILCNPKLSAWEMILFGYIVNLSQAKGHCWATNNYLGSLVGLKPRSISESISRLANMGYVTVEFQNTNKQTNEQTRFITPSTEYPERYKNMKTDFYQSKWVARECYPPSTTVLPPTHENANIIIHNKDTYKKLSSKEDSRCPDGHCPIVPSENKPYKKRQKLSLENETGVNRQSAKSDLTKTKTVKRQTSYVNPLPISENVQTVFDYWTGLGLHLPAEGTRLFNTCITMTESLLNGSMFDQNYSMEEIKQSITHFSISVFDNECEPADPILKKELSKKPISDFIYNKFRTNGNSSLFRKYLDPPKMIKAKDLIPNPNPMMVNNLKSFYQNEVLGGVALKLRPSEENQFRVSVKKLKEFYKENFSKFSQFMNVNEVLLCGWLCESIKASCGDDLKKVTPAWFASDATFNRRLPAYLFSQSIIVGNGYENGGGFSIYDDI